MGKFGGGALPKPMKDMLAALGKEASNVTADDIKTPGFVLSCVTLDLMHVADLGISQALVGNCLYEFFLSLGGVISAPSSTLGDMLTMIGIASKHLGFDRPLNDLTLGMFKQQSKTPRLRAKAAETRHMVAVIDWIFTNMFKPKNPHDELRQRCVHQLALFYEELGRWDIDSPRRAATFGRQHVVLYGNFYVRHLRVAIGRARSGTPGGFTQSTISSCIWWRTPFPRQGIRSPSGVTRTKTRWGRPSISGTLATVGTAIAASLTSTACEQKKQRVCESKKRSWVGAEGRISSRLTSPDLFYHHHHRCIVNQTEKQQLITETTNKRGDTTNQTLQKQINS